MGYKRILTIQDISCVGQCSMTVAMPVLSACGHETCILPTAVLSTHTGGFGTCVVRHLSGEMDAMAEHWRSQGIDFDAILVGYLGSVEAVQSTRSIVETMLAPGGCLIVDPAMADHGKLYSGLSEEYAGEMLKLCEIADIVLPNITEAAMMAGLEYQADYVERDIFELLNRIGCRQVVLTGVGFAPGETGVAIRTGEEVNFYHHPRLGGNYHGTGDMFAACFTGCLMQGKDIGEAVKIAAEFVCRSIESTQAAPAHWYGVKFETALPWLIRTLFR